MTISRFHSIILAWYKRNRRDLPWRRTRNPYKILVSEVMLQQTQVSRVIPKYKEFLEAFPTLSILARARIKRLLQVWNGLGYWRRALYLKETAKALRNLVSKDSETKFLSDPKTLEKLPGIGHYTARALACFAFGNSEAFLDTNIRRVYLHFFFRNRKSVLDKEILKIAQEATSNLCSSKKLMYPKITPREWHYALMDYGATVLKDRAINKRSKHYHKQSKFEGSFRSSRTKVVRFLLSQPKYRATHQKIKTLLAKAPYPQTEILASLLKDRLIKKSKRYFTI